MTRYERTLQLERRKTIATGIAVVVMTTTFLSGCCYIAHNADEDITVVIDNDTADRPTASEIEEVEITPVPVVVVELPEEETEEVEIPEITYSVDDYERLAHLIWCEAGNAGEQAMIFTGSVVLNRRDDKRFANTIKGVIAEPHQYGVKHYYMRRKPSKRAYEIAQDLLENGSQLPADIVAQASVRQYKKYGKRLYAKIGKIYFFSIRG